MRRIHSAVLLAAVLALGAGGCAGRPNASAAPDRPKAAGYFQDAERLAGEGKHTEALAAADLAKRADPTMAEAYLFRARLLSESSHFREAREELLAAHSALPDDLSVAVALLTDTQVDFPPVEAEAIARKVALKHPESGEAHYFLGLAIVNSGDPSRREEALKSLETANRLNPGGTLPLTEIAKIYLQTGRPERALAALESGATILDQAMGPDGMPIPTLEEWLRQRKAIAFWTADALRKLRRDTESRKAAALANRLSARSSEIRALKSRTASPELAEAARARLMKIASTGFSIDDTD